MAVRMSSLTPSGYISSGTVNPAMSLVVPAWLNLISTKILSTARIFAPRFASASRKFWYRVVSAGTTHIATIYCEGPYVQISAWDHEFTVPVGGFKYGDIDPVTGEPFPGGTQKRGSYISLVDKPEVEGEKVKSISRTYTRYSGRTIKKTGFFSESLRQNVGHGIFLSTIGRNNLQLLALSLGKEIARSIGRQIKLDGERAGLSVYVGPVQVITTEG